MRGDLLQAFSLKRYQNMPICSVEFGIFPLCLPQPVYLDVGGYMLDEFLADEPEADKGWIFDSDSDKSMEKCVESIANAIDRHLIPLFEVGRDCETALSELIKLEELRERNRQIRLQQEGIADCAAPWQERSLFDYRKYYMALKARDMAYARRYFNFRIKSNESRLRSFEEPDSPMQPDIVKERHRAQLVLFKKALERIDSGDFLYFDDLLRSNEEQMLKFLADKYPKVYSQKRELE